MRRRIPAVALLAAVLAVSCSSGGGSDGAEPAEFRNVVDMRSRATGSYPEVHVAVKDNDFVAPAIRINPGTTVSWKNEGSQRARHPPRRRLARFRRRSSASTPTSSNPETSTSSASTRRASTGTTARCTARRTRA